MGGEGPKHLPPLFRGVNPQHCLGDGTVRDKDEAEGHDQNENAGHSPPGLIVGDVPTGQCD